MHWYSKGPLNLNCTFVIYCKEVEMMSDPSREDNTKLRLEVEILGELRYLTRS